MWQRTKRLINSYLDDLIERTTGPDREAREVTRAELARLNELEVQTRASAKVLEKELAGIELKILGVAERERLARERGDQAAASESGRQLLSLDSQRMLIKQQITEANAAAERARALREERRRQGEDLAAETHLTTMRENLAAVQSPFGSADPAGTIEEMRARIGRSGASLADNGLAEADRELEAERARARVDEMLSQYKQASGSLPSSQDKQVTRTPSSENTPESSTSVEEQPSSQDKTLGRTDRPVRPID
jgi:hypothetical protein